MGNMKYINSNSYHNPAPLFRNNNTNNKLDGAGGSNFTIGT